MRKRHHLKGRAARLVESECPGCLAERVVELEDAMAAILDAEYADFEGEETEAKWDSYFAARDVALEEGIRLLHQKPEHPEATQPGGEA